MYKRYEKMKDSGIEWIGEIPEHWQLKKLKYIGNSIIGITYTPNDMTESSAYGTLVLRASNIQNGRFAQNDNVYINSVIPKKLYTRKGDILLCSRSGSRELIGKNITIDETNERCTFGAFMTIFRTDIWKFVSYFFNSSIFSAQSTLFMTSTINQLTIDTLNNLFISIPPLPEQKAIAAFLDRETSRIDKLIEKKERHIELLKEKRQALITRAVTRGLDPAVKMKDSGVKWIGEIPEHWEVKKIKHISDIFGRIGFRGYTLEDIVDEREGAITLSPSNFINGRIDFTKCTYISWEKYNESPEIKVAENDVIIVKTGSTIGKVAIVERLPHPTTINPQLAIFKNIRCNNYFLFWYIISPFIQEQVNQSNTGGTIPTMTQATIGNYSIPYPPFPEQDRIVDYLEIQTHRIDLLLDTINFQITKLRELRQTLISDAVTGKIDVRDYVTNEEITDIESRKVEVNA